jgi:glycerol-3-phosphate dehydrogenase
MSAMAALSDADYDLLVVGGGINGAGIARDAAGRGLKVLLCERHDLAAHTSSASTKLIHGGLRYLEHGHFGLVRKALREREVLLGLAPHITRPLRFVMPHAPHLRPAWLIRCGLFLYDHLSRRNHLPGSKRIDLRTHPAGQALATTYQTGFTYFDAWVDDARLVVLNAMSARELGATIKTYCEVERLVAKDREWSATLRGDEGAPIEIKARAVVNAAGPWAAQLRQAALGEPGALGLRLVKGSHIVVAKLFDHNDAYIFQAQDRRIIFAIPYEDRYTLVGTTDVDYRGSLQQVSIDPAEIDYLCSEANQYFKRQISARDVVWSFAGVRPLQDDETDDASGASRDYHLELTSRPAPMLTVFGGKITTYRVLAAEAVELIGAALGCRHEAWTHRKPLPGGDLPSGGIAQLAHELQSRQPRLPDNLRQRWVGAYGSRVSQLLADGAKSVQAGEEVLPGLHAAEVRYLMAHEFARSAEDILWRRTKLGLHLDSSAAATLQQWICANIHTS